MQNVSSHDYSGKVTWDWNSLWYVLATLTVLLPVCQAKNALSPGLSASFCHQPSSIPFSSAKAVTLPTF